MKLKKVLVAPAILPHFFVENRTFKVTSGLPLDVAFVGLILDPHANVFHIYVKSPEFDDVSGHASVPEAQVSYTTDCPN